MKLAVMQPYFFPYLGYFQLMNKVDNWVVFDDVQFIGKGWINRNRILHPETIKKWQYITVPLKKRGQFDKISQLSINNNIRWREEITGKLTSYRRKAPFYKQTMEFVCRCLQHEDSNLSNFLISVLKETVEMLQIKTTIFVYSGMNLDVGKIWHPGQWALRIAERMYASEYINSYGGTRLFDNREFEHSRIKLSFLKPNLREYTQRRVGFIPNLSVIDVMMWNSLEEIQEMLISDYQLIESNDLIRQ